MLPPWLFVAGNFPLSGTKGLELAKLARRDRPHSDCATWLHKARQMPKEDVKKEVEKELTGRETEPWENIYFKLFQSQMPVIERAIETAALMLGTYKSRGLLPGNDLCGFPGWANLDNGDPETLLFSVTRFSNSSLESRGRHSWEA